MSIPRRALLTGGFTDDGGPPPPKLGDGASGLKSIFCWTAAPRGMGFSRLSVVYSRMIKQIVARK